MSRNKLTRNANRVSNGLEATESGGTQSMQQFKSGDIAWVKIGKSSWWPGQVVDEGIATPKSKKKVKDEILVRLYGTYEYLYVDPVKCSSEFENILKQENISTREAFQRALEEDRSRLTSGGKSKREVPNSREKSAADAPINKKRKQAGMENIKTPGVSGEAVDARSEGKGRNRSSVQPTRKSQRKLDEATKLKETLPETLPACDEANKKIRVQPARESKRKQEEATNLKITQLANDGANKKEPKRDALGKRKQVDTKQSQNVGPEIKDKKLKSKDVKEHKAEKVGETSEGRKLKQGVVAKANPEKAKIGTSKDRNLKQKDENVKKVNGTLTPIPIKKGAAEETTTDLSARRLKVMQSLGLIAPSGSPFRRNGFVVASKLQ